MLLCLPSLALLLEPWLDAEWCYSCMPAAGKGKANAPGSSGDLPLKIHFS
jgi:hypothetical protein